MTQAKYCQTCKYQSLNGHIEPCSSCGAYKNWEAPEQDMVNAPKHYTAGGIETIEYMKAKMTPDMFQGFLLGNILKYVSRHKDKNGLEDLKKALWYLTKLIEETEGEK